MTSLVIDQSQPKMHWTIRYKALWKCICILGCFKKDTLKKNKTFTPACNWGVPRKFISRRKCWSHKSRGLAKWLKVWQNLQLGNLGYPRPRHIKVHILRMPRRAMLSSLLLKFEGLKPAHRFLNPATVMITFCRKSSLWTVRIRSFTILICL